MGCTLQLDMTYSGAGVPIGKQQTSVTGSHSMIINLMKYSWLFKRKLRRSQSVLVVIPWLKDLHRERWP